MKLSRIEMNAVCDLSKIKNWDAFPQEIRDKAAAKCADMLPKIYQITEIEGVRNLSGAQAVLEKACMTVLNKLGAKPSDDTLDALILDRAFALEFTAAAPTVSAPSVPTLPDGDLDF